VRETLKVNCGDSNPQAELRKAERLDPKQIVADRIDDLGIKPAELQVETPLADPPPGSVTGYTIPTDVTTGKPLPRVWMTLLPTKHSWHVPALLMFGNFNDCPPPAVHAAMHRYWERKFGSEIVGITADTIETHAPGLTLQGASPVPVAREQYAYAPDIVEQGTDDLATLASILGVSDKWYFWWD
jgi:hypothetical protein